MRENTVLGNYYVRIKAYSVRIWRLELRSQIQLTDRLTHISQTVSSTGSCLSSRKVPRRSTERITPKDKASVSRLWGVARDTVLKIKTQHYREGEALGRLRVFSSVREGQAGQKGSWLRHWTLHCWLLRGCYARGGGQLYLSKLCHTHNFFRLAQCPEPVALPFWCNNWGKPWHLKMLCCVSFWTTYQTNRFYPGLGFEQEQKQIV